MSNTATAQARSWNRPTNVNGYAQGIPYGPFQSNGHFFTNPNADLYNENFDLSMNGLSQSMGGVMLQGIDYSSISKQHNPPPTNGAANTNGVQASQANTRMFYTLPNGSLVCSGAAGVQSTYPQYLSNYGLNAVQSGQLQQASFPNLLGNAPTTPRGHPWMVASQVPQELPELAPPRRTSLSSNEADSPQTPMFGYQPQSFGSNLSPNSLAIYGSSNPDSPWQIAKQRSGEAVWVDFEAWTTMSPPIPVAVPAIDSPGGGRGTLDQIMSNPNGTLNVYVRGLHPETNDEMLLAYGKRFGDVVSAKSIIDAATGQCKG